MTISPDTIPYLVIFDKAMSVPTEYKAYPCHDPHEDAKGGGIPSQSEADSASASYDEAIQVASAGKRIRKVEQNRMLRTINKGIVCLFFAMLLFRVFY